MKNLRFVYLLQAGERYFSPHIHSTWEEPFSAALYKHTTLRHLIPPQKSTRPNESSSCTVKDGSQAEPVWVDTMGWDDDSHKDETAFKSILRFLRDEDLKVRAILWMILPNIRQGGDS